jgi:adenylate cyclase
MDAPSNIDPVTAYSDSDVVHWLTNDTRDERFIDNIFAEMCIRLPRAGIPVNRATLHILIHHPQMVGRPDHVGRRDARGRACES